MDPGLAPRAPCRATRGAGMHARSASTAAARRDRGAASSRGRDRARGGPRRARGGPGRERQRVAELAARLVTAARANRHRHGGVDAFMHEYGLTSEEGIILMCLAEALLRIPDADTADALIAEKIGEGRWEKHLGASDSWFVNASTFGLMLTGRVVRLGEEKGTGPAATLKRLIARSGEPIIRQAAAPGHAHPRRQLRARAHHRGGARPGRGLRGAGLPLLLRHAGRAGQDGGRRRALSRPLPVGDRGDREARGAAAGGWR